MTELEFAFWERAFLVAMLSGGVATVRATETWADEMLAVWREKRKEVENHVEKVVSNG